MLIKKKKYHHGDLREHLLEAVRELIEQHGPEGWSIAEACRLAGVSTAAPYKHFKDRDEILRGVLLAGMERMGASMRLAADSYPAGDPRRIVALGKSYTEFARKEPGIFALMFGGKSAAEEESELAEEGREKFGIVIRVVAEHLNKRMDDPDVNARAYALWCAVHGHSFLSLGGKNDETKVTVSEDDYLALVGNAFLPPQ